MISYIKTRDIQSGVWDTIRSQTLVGAQEPMLFYDESRLYLYEGFGDTVALTGVELDPSTFQAKRTPVPLIRSGKEHNGWEKARLDQRNALDRRCLDDGEWEINFGSFAPNDMVCGYFQVWDTKCVGGSDYAHCWEC